MCVARVFAPCRRSSRMAVHWAVMRATGQAAVHYLANAMVPPGGAVANEISVVSGWQSATSVQRHTPKPPSAIRSCARSTATHHAVAPRTSTTTLRGAHRTPTHRDTTHAQRQDRRSRACSPPIEAPRQFSTVVAELADILHPLCQGRPPLAACTSTRLTRSLVTTEVRPSKLHRPELCGRQARITK